MNERRNAVGIGLTRIAAGMTGVIVPAITRHQLPELASKILGGNEGRANFEHALEGVGIPLLAVGGLGAFMGLCGMSEEEFPTEIMAGTAVALWFLFKVFIETEQSSAYSRPFQIEQLMFLGAGLGIGYGLTWFSKKLAHHWALAGGTGTGGN